MSLHWKIAQFGATRPMEDWLREGAVLHMVGWPNAFWWAIRLRLGRILWQVVAARCIAC